MDLNDSKVDEYLQQHLPKCYNQEYYLYPKHVVYEENNDEFTFQVLKLKTMVTLEKSSIEVFKDVYAEKYRNQSKTIIVRNRQYLIVLEEERVSVVACRGPEPGQILLRLLRDLACYINEQRGMVLMHGAACVLNNKGILLLGSKCAGKTTLLSRFMEQGAKLLANDRVFLSMKNDEIQMWSLPLPLRVGVGTIEAIPAYKTYCSDKMIFYRKQSQNSLEALAHRHFTPMDDKIILTNKECERIFNIEAIDCAALDVVIMPQIFIGGNNLKISNPSEREVSRIFWETCFTPDDESFRIEWLTVDGKSKTNSLQGEKYLSNICTRTKTLGLSYGTELSTYDFLQNICD